MGLKFALFQLQLTLQCCWLAGWCFYRFFRELFFTLGDTLFSIATLCIAVFIESSLIAAPRLGDLRLFIS